MIGLLDDCGCAYCGLPLSDTAATADEEAYCCFGCRFAAAVAAETGEEGRARWTLTRLGLAVFFTMNVMVFTLVLWSWDVESQAMSPATAQTLFELFRYLALLFSVPVLLLLGAPLIENAIASVRCGTLTTDPLIAIGVLAAFAYSFVSIVMGGEHIYFEVGCVVLVAVTLGRWLEASGKLRTTRALRSLEHLLPETVRAVELGGHGVEARVSLDQVVQGQWLRVLPGERITTDGTIRRGQAAIDEQIVTGESTPAIKEQGDAVLAGSLNLDGDLLIEVTASPQDGALQRLIRAVCDAALAKGRLQSTADRIASWFTPMVVGVACLSFVVHQQSAGFAAALMTLLAVLLIACPCALGVAMPLAIFTAMGRASQMGVVFRNSDAIARLASVEAVCFDKTGTLTKGDAFVERVIVADDNSLREVLARAYCVAAASTHPLSRAISDYTSGAADCEENVIAEYLQAMPGRGTSAIVAGEPLYLGSRRLMNEADLVIPPTLDESAADLDDGPRTFVGWGGRVRGLFVLREHIRSEAKEALAQLQHHGLTICALTGDHARRAGVVAEELGIEVRSDLLPEEKLSEVTQIQEQRGPVAMVGDGVNDAPALVAADCGIALGCGADVSRDVADVCLLGNDLTRIPWAIDLARQTMRVARTNLAWAFAYNTFGIGLAVTGLLSPVWAAVLMVGSSLFVVSNSLRLAGFGGMGVSIASTSDTDRAENASPLAV